MNKPSPSRYLSLLRWLLGAVFVLAAITKLPHPLGFYEGLLAYQLPLPPSLLRMLAMVLPWLELACGLLLWLNVWTTAALALSGVMLLGFTIALVTTLARGLDIVCGCLDLSLLGIADRAVVRAIESPPLAIVRNLLLTACVVHLYRKTGGGRE